MNADNHHAIECVRITIAITAMNAVQRWTLRDFVASANLIWMRWKMIRNIFPIFSIIVNFTLLIMIIYNIRSNEKTRKKIDKFYRFIEIQENYKIDEENKELEKKLNHILSEFDGKRRNFRR